jgi:tetratricopeptide (TPR) repeat protein
MLALERPNLEKAHACFVASGRHSEAIRTALVLVSLMSEQGPLARAVEQLNQAIALGCPAARDEHGELELRALMARAHLLRLSGKLHEAERDAVAALELARTCANVQAEVDLLRSLGVIHLRQGDIEESRRCLDLALSLCRTRGARKHEGRILSELGYLELALGRLDEARQDLEAAMVLHHEADDSRWSAIAFHKLAMLAHVRGRTEEARFLCERALSTARQSEEPRFEALYLFQLGHLERELGNAEAASAAFDRAFELYRTLGSAIDSAFVLVDRASLQAELGQRGLARLAYERALELLRAANQRGAEACVLARLSFLEAADGHHELALALSRLAIERAGNDEWIAWSVAVYGSLVALLAEDRTTLEGPAPSARESAERLAARRPAACVPVLGSMVLWPRSEPYLAGRALERYLSAASASSPNASLRPHADGRTYVIAASGRWFETPDGRQVSVESRPTLHAILRELVTERERAPGVGLGTSDIFARVWVGQKIDPSSARSRVYSSLWLLRDFGLREAIAKRDGKYLLAPELTRVVKTT